VRRGFRFVQSGLAIALAALLAGAGEASAGATRQLADLLVADARLATEVARGGWSGAARELLADDGIVLLPGEDLPSGSHQAARQVARWSESAREPALHHLAAAVSQDGRLGFSAGWAEQQEGGGKTFLRYVAVWTRRAGCYRVAVLALARAKKPAGPPPADSAIARHYSGSAQPQDEGQLRSEVLATDRAFAARAAAIAASSGFGPAFVEFADPNAVAIGQDEIGWGRKEVGEAYAKTDPGERLGWEPVAGGTAGSGDLAWTVGLAVYEPPRGRPAYSKYLTIWARQPDGSFKWLVDVGVSRPAPASR